MTIAREVRRFKAAARTGSAAFRAVYRGWPVSLTITGSTWISPGIRVTSDENGVSGNIVVRGNTWGNQI